MGYLIVSKELLNKGLLLRKNSNIISRVSLTGWRLLYEVILIAAFRLRAIESRGGHWWLICVVIVTALY